MGVRAEAVQALREDYPPSAPSPAPVHPAAQAPRAEAKVAANPILGEPATVVPQVRTRQRMMMRGSRKAVAIRNMEMAE